MYLAQLLNSLKEKDPEKCKRVEKELQEAIHTSKYCGEVVSNMTKIIAKECPEISMNHFMLISAELVGVFIKNSSSKLMEAKPPTGGLKRNLQN